MPTTSHAAMNAQGLEITYLPARDLEEDADLFSSQMKKRFLESATREKPRLAAAAWNAIGRRCKERLWKQCVHNATVDNCWCGERAELCNGEVDGHDR